MKLKTTFKQLAQSYFGIEMVGLNCKPCSYEQFKEWYNNSHTRSCTYEIYLVAMWVWNYYEPNF